MENNGIFLRFLPPSITQRLQPLDLVVCGLLKQRRGVYLSNKVWRQEQLSWHIQGQAAKIKEKLPPLQQWKPPTLTLLDGIFQYHRTHEEELQLDTTKESIEKSFIHTGIPPHRIRLTLSGSGTVSKVKISKVNHKSSVDLLKVYRFFWKSIDCRRNR